MLHTGDDTTEVEWIVREGIARINDGSLRVWNAQRYQVWLIGCSHPSFERDTQKDRRQGYCAASTYGTPVGGDAQFYKDIPISPMTYGQSMALLILIEAFEYISGLFIRKG